MSDLSLDEQIRIIEDFEKLTGVTIDTSHPWETAPPVGPLLSRCVMVVGVTRSGTSAIAGCLHFLGVKMCGSRVVGDANPFGTFEDKEFVNARPLVNSEDGHRWQFNTASLRAYASLIRQRNATYSLWGVKSFGLLFGFAGLYRAFEDLRLVIVQRDPEAIRASFEKWGNKMGTPGVDDQLHILGLVISLANKAGIPMKAVSYEHLLDDPRGYVEQLAQFAYEGTGMEAVDLEVERAVRHVRPELRHF